MTHARRRELRDGEQEPTPTHRSHEERCRWLGYADLEEWAREWGYASVDQLVLDVPLNPGRR